MNQQVEDAFLELDGLQFHYRDWDGQGRSLVLVHGLASTSHIWDLVAPLLTRDFQVLALDQRGHGQTDQPDTGYDFDTVVDDLAAFRRTMALEKPVLVGHSWGGNVVLQYAAAHPDELSALVLVDGGFLDIRKRPGITWEKARDDMTPPDLAGTPREEFLDSAREWLGEVWSPEVRDIVLANFHVQEDDTVRPRFQRSNHMQVVRALWEQRPGRLYPKVRCPVLMIPAMRSNAEGVEAEFMAAKVKSVAEGQEKLTVSETLRMHQTLHDIPLHQTLHDIPLHRPQDLAAAIRDFVERHAGAA